MFQVVGNKKGEVVLLLPPDDMTAQELYEPLKKLGDKFCVLLPEFSSGEGLSSRAKAMETALLRDYHLQLAGAYGLGQGGNALLELLALGNVYIRSAVVEGPCGLPKEIADVRGTLYYWKGSKNGKAKRECKALRKKVPGLRTLTMKKLKEGQEFIACRPDLMAKQLEKLFSAPKPEKRKHRFIKNCKKGA